MSCALSGLVFRGLGISCVVREFGFWAAPGVPRSDLCKLHAVLLLEQGLLRGIAGTFQGLQNPKL